ncbi:manganese ABC transporter permease [Corynebacterium phocae]|uniref:Manganese ABC transporter permease n=1 Tax=Corynebacterium phocae TaxID=161895 RepID=A0A1L7D1C8_9CORY|nr:metal ABC transporter permease [Corynebacterium phocae]APT91842.1 manganese ABC transporter permease [Corynebacterium phocae]KAA8727451.1 metal ABC transporter permease [Corynebacterium phocae]
MSPLELFSDYTYRQALIGTVTVGAAAGAIGPLVFVRRQSLLADAIAHSALPGLLGAFLVAVTLGLDGRNVPMLMIGSLISASLAVFVIYTVIDKLPIKVDAAMAATLTTFFASGMLLMQYISRRPLPGKAGIQDYLLGNASTLTQSDVNSILVAGGGTVLVLSLVHRVHATITSDLSFARVAGLPIKVVDVIAFFSLIVITVIGVKVVGVVLMVSVIIAPAVAARQFVHRLIPFIVLCAVIGAITAAVGCYLSIAFGAPTGPCIVVMHALTASAALIWKKVSRA